MKMLAQKSGIFSSTPAKMKDPHVYDEFVRLRPDLTLLAFVTDIVPEKLLTVPIQGTICYHPSLLPRHRGASAINWAIIQGDTRTGLTVFWVDKGIDTGPIVLQKEVEIGPGDTTGSLYFNTLFPMGVDAMIEALELIKKGTAPRIPQDESKSTYDPPCDDRVASVVFDKPGKDVYNLVRGCDPQPGAYTVFRGKKVRFYDASLQAGAQGKIPGEVVFVNEKKLGIALRDGVLGIGKLKVEKGEKTGPGEFVQSVGLEVGDRFGEK
jgi:methionyl-tRNA formyltransferase